MEVTNLPAQCAIRLIHSSNDVPVTQGVTLCKIKRREHGSFLWRIMKTITISSAADLNFVVTDYSVQAGHIYDYCVKPVIDGIEQVGVIYNNGIKCEFDDVFIGNATKQFTVYMNTKLDVKAKYAVVYVQPLFSAYPHSIHNGNMKYSSGSLTGIYMHLDARGNPTTFGADDYRHQVTDFFLNGEVKLLKAPDGRAWGVQIDEQYNEKYDAIKEATEITVNWTEVQSASELAENLVVLT